MEGGRQQPSNIFGGSAVHSGVPVEETGGVLHRLGIQGELQLRGLGHQGGGGGDHRGGQGRRLRNGGGGAGEEEVLRVPLLLQLHPRHEDPPQRHRLQQLRPAELQHKQRGDPQENI